MAAIHFTTFAQAQGQAPPQAQVAGAAKDEVAIVLIYAIIAAMLTAVYQTWQSRRIAGAMHG